LNRAEAKASRNGEKTQTDKTLTSFLVFNSPTAEHRFELY
jgi:hypothetical protein